MITCTCTAYKGDVQRVAMETFLLLQLTQLGLLMCPLLLGQLFLCFNLCFQQTQQMQQFQCLLLLLLLTLPATTV